MLMVEVADPERLPSDAVVVSVLAVVLLAAGV
jgi:hypothetical protein